MPLTRTEARDEILTKIKSVVDTLSDFVAIYDDKRQDIPDGSSPVFTWARVTVRHNTGAQTAIANAVGARLYTKTGIVTIQLFTPTGDGLTSSDTLSDQFEQALRGISTPNGVWFRNPRSNEIGNSGPWFQTNIVLEFEYDQTS